MSAGIRATLATVDGQRALILSPEIPEDAPQRVREGLARRALVAIGQPCPCGAVGVWPNRAQRRAAVRERRVLRMTCEHEDGCPAPDPWGDSS